MATIIGTPGKDKLIGTLDADLIYGLESDDTLYGLAGNDTLEGGLGNDFLDGGDGFDYASYRFAAEDKSPGSKLGVNVDLAAGRSSGADGIDTLTGIEGITGSSFNDTLIGDDGGNQLEGLAGDDLLVGGAGFDSTIYSGASGAVFVNLLTGKASGADGIDTLIDIEAIQGSSFNDILTGNISNNAIVGAADGDTIVGGAGDDTLAGDDFNVNAISGPPGNDSISGGTGNDFLTGEGGNDILNGDDGNDILIGGAGNETLNGGTGFDAAGYDLAPAAVNVNLTIGRASGGDGSDRLSNIEAVSGSIFNDTLIGSAGSNNLFGGAGNDTLDGREGNDQLFGSQGNDTLNGGTGFDSADYNNLGQAITLLPQGQISKGSLGTDLILNIEKIVGATGQANTIDGSSGTGGTSFTINLSANSLVVNNIPGIGTATFVVENFINVTGTPNSDTITGNSSNNILVGSAGNDTLFGGIGNDTLVGGLNADQFGFNFDFFQPPLGIDFIKDFNFLEADKILIKSSGGTPTLERFTFVSSTGALFFDKTQFATLQLGSGFDVWRDITIV